MSDVSVRPETIREEAGSITISITGQVDIFSIGGLLMQLSDTFKITDEVIIDLSGVTEIDVAALRLFCSCHCSSIFFNKEFRITGQGRPAIWDAAASAGCLRKSECVIDSKHTCIWVRGAC